VIEDLIYFERVAYRDVNGVRAAYGVEIEGSFDRLNAELRPYVPFFTAISDDAWQGYAFCSPGYNLSVASQPTQVAKPSLSHNWRYH
jgi:hypothetical protein